MIAFDTVLFAFCNVWWQSMFVQHEVSKGANDLVVQSHSFEPMSDSLVQHTAWKLEVWWNKLEGPFNQPFVFNLLVSIGSIVSIVSKTQIACMNVNVRN